MAISKIPSAGTTGFGRRNLLINGAMVIDQRNGGSSVSLSSSVVHCTDRFITRLGTSTSSTAQQVSDAPDGFTNSLKLTIGTGASPSAGTGDGYLAYAVEGFDSAYLEWGGSTAKTITLSFWIKSSQTGTFAATIANYSITRSYPISYTIDDADTWERKTITVSGDTTGGWATNNSGSIYMFFDWGNGSNFKGTANAWASADYRGGATGTQSICATSGATWQITGVQLEVGSTATEFEHRSYGEELALCQRYYQLIDSCRKIPAIRFKTSGGSPYGNITFCNAMRTSPSFSYTGTWITATGYAGTPTLQLSGTTSAAFAGSTIFSANDSGWFDSTDGSIVLDAEL